MNLRDQGAYDQAAARCEDAIRYFEVFGNASLVEKADLLLEEIKQA